MKYRNKYRLRLEDGRSEPIPGLEGASRIIMIDEEQVGAQDITFGYSKYKPKGSIHKNTPIRMRKKSCTFFREGGSEG